MTHDVCIVLLKPTPATAVWFKVKETAKEALKPATACAAIYNAMASLWRSLKGAESRAELLQ